MDMQVADAEIVFSTTFSIWCIWSTGIPNLLLSWPVEVDYTSQYVRAQPNTYRIWITNASPNFSISAVDINVPPVPSLPWFHRIFAAWTASFTSLIELQSTWRRFYISAFVRQRLTGVKKRYWSFQMHSEACQIALLSFLRGKRTVESHILLQFE